MARFHGLVATGKNCYYRLLERKTMGWRRLLMAMAVRSYAILRKEEISATKGTDGMYLSPPTLLCHS